jgi:enoyl-CoA hydratase
VLWATIDRPAARNAINQGVIEGLEAAVERATSSGARALVIRGAGGTFCAGADLGMVRAMIDDPAGFAAVITRLAGALDALEAAPFASVAVVDGYAVAGGCELLMACDVAVADEAARLGDRHLELALLPGAGGSVRLHRALSPARSRWLLLSGEMISGREAAEWGLVTRAVPAGELDAVAERMVARLASRSGEALAAAKRMAMAVRHRSVADGILAERGIFLEHMAGSADARAALEAFLEKET